MPGLYSHTTRSAGTVVTATIYNTDHQNHVDNHVPSSIDDWSNDTTQMRLTADPYSSQTTEQLATSLDGEITRLRYMVKQILDYLNGVDASGSSASATTALGTAIGQWYFGIRNPALRLVGAKVYNSTTFSHTTSGTRQACTFDSEVYDQDGAGTGFHSTSVNTSRLTVPSNLGGKYHIGGAASFVASATGTLREVSVRKNGATYLATEITSWAITADRRVELTVACDADLVATDYVELILNQNIASPSLVAGPDNTAGPQFWIHLIGS
jgi:hypothetical protein